MDSTSSWTYSSSTIRPADNNTNNRITFLDGLQQSSLTANYQNVASISTGNIALGIGVDSTTAYTGAMADTFAGNGALNSITQNTPLLGLHYVQALECTPNGAVATGTYYAEISTSPTYQLTLSIEM